MKLRFPISRIGAIASRYTDSTGDEELSNLRLLIQERGFLDKDQLRLVARWKSPRSAARVETNSDRFVREITGISLRSAEERTQIEVLTLLDGISWPSASVILHFFHQEKFPILDYRAVWSLSSQVPSRYTHEFWSRYAKYCRKLSDRSGVPMRTLDRALWQYSKENQGSMKSQRPKP